MENKIIVRKYEEKDLSAMIPRQPRTSYWRKAGKGLRSPGKSTWLPCTAV